MIRSGWIECQTLYFGIFLEQWTLWKLSGYAKTKATNINDKIGLNLISNNILLYNFCLFLTVAIVEIERLWYRFKMLGCNDDGILTSEVLQRPPASEDIFVKNVRILRYWNRITIINVFCVMYRGSFDLVQDANLLLFLSFNPYTMDPC